MSFKVFDIIKENESHGCISKLLDKKIKNGSECSPTHTPKRRTKDNIGWVSAAKGVLFECNEDIMIWINTDTEHYEMLTSAYFKFSDATRAG